jgi:hypothetical protein
MKRGDTLTDETGCAWKVEEVVAATATTLLVRLAPGAMSADKGTLTEPAP